MQNQNSTPKLYSKLFVLLCLSTFLFSASFNMIIPELPDYLSAMGGEDYIGLIIGLFTLTAGLSRPFSGKLTDTVGRMPVQIIGTLVCVFTSLLYPLATGIFGFLLLRFLHGFSTGFKPTATSAYLADIVPVDRRGEAMGIMGVSMNLGASISPPIGSFLAMEYSMNTMFFASSVVALLSVLILLGMKETLEKKEKFAIQHLKLNRKDIIDKSAIPPAIMCFFIYMSLGTTITICPDMCNYLGVANKGMFFTSFTVFSIASRLFAGKVSDKYGRELVLQWSMVLLAASLFYFNFVDSEITLLLATGFLGFSIGVASPAVFAWAIDRCEDKNRGKALATLYISLEFSIGLGAVVFALIYDNNPINFGLTYTILAFVALIGLIYVVNFRRKLKVKV